jgi:hypothetical protein
MAAIGPGLYDGSHWSCIAKVSQTKPMAAQGRLRCDVAVQRARCIELRAADKRTNESATFLVQPAKSSVSMNLQQLCTSI